MMRIGDGLSAAPAPLGLRGRPSMAMPTMRMAAAVARAAEAAMPAALRASDSWAGKPPVRGADSSDWNDSHSAANERAGGRATVANKPADSAAEVLGMVWISPPRRDNQYVPALLPMTWV